MKLAAFLTIVIVTAVGQTKPQRLADLLKLSGYEAVATMDFFEFSVTSISRRNRTMELTGPKKRTITVRFDGRDEQISVPYFEEADVSEKPLTFRDSDVFRVGDKLQVSRFAIMRPLQLERMSEKLLREPTIGKEPHDEMEYATDDNEVPLLAQVEDVIILDTPEKRTAYEKLPPSAQNEMLRVAGSVDGLNDAQPIEALKLSDEQKALMNMGLVNRWVERRERDWAVALGIEALFMNSKIRVDEEREVVRRFNELPLDQRRAIVALSRKAKARGFDSLTARQKQFVHENRFFIRIAGELSDSDESDS